MAVRPLTCPYSRRSAASCMSHVLVIAAIFVPYMAFMVGLGAYIAGQVRQDDDPPDTGRRDQTEIRLAGLAAS